MNMTTQTLIVGIALVLAVVGTVRPAWPLVPIAVILVCVAFLIGKT